MIQGDAGKGISLNHDHASAHFPALLCPAVFSP